MKLRVDAALLLAALPVVCAAADATNVSGLDVMKVDVLFVGAHPDDDGGVLATFARYGLDEGFRTGVVTVTGGEGGGNATGRESGRALGLVRRVEELNALAFAGVAATDFLGLEDFYFTLSAEEAERRWGSDFVCDVTRLVRLRRPAVIVTMWPGPGTHGQHQMAARAATLAFARAGEAAFCREQVENEGIEPFSPDKLYYYDRPDAEASLSVATGDFSPSAHMRYADLKALALMQYRSQGFDRFVHVPFNDPPPESFQLVRTRVPVEQPERHLLAGVLLPAGSSPPGVRLDAVGAYRAPLGRETGLVVGLTNTTGRVLEEVRFELSGPDGWSLQPDGKHEPARVAAGDHTRQLHSSARPRSDHRP